MTELELTLKGVKNYNVAVREWNDRVIFLRKVLRGGTDKSYGIQVARLAGLPRSVIDRAGVILDRLEKEAITADGRPRLAGDDPAPDSTTGRQLYLFDLPSAHPVIEELKNINLDHLTPFEAMQRLRSLKGSAREDG